MNKLQLTFAAILLNFFLGDSIWAQEEGEWPKTEKVHVLNSAKQVLEPDYRDIMVEVQNEGDHIIIDASFVVPVAPQQAWAVLTDFENVPQFNPGVLSSRVTRRADNHCHVSQKSITKYGFMAFPLESVREVKLVPFEKIHERMISGDMRKLEETTQLLPERNQTRIIYHAVLVPGIWIPPTVGDVFIKQETREQFQTVINEIVRRKQLMTVSR